MPRKGTIRPEKDARKAIKQEDAEVTETTEIRRLVLITNHRLALLAQLDVLGEYLDDLDKQIRGEKAKKKS